MAQGFLTAVVVEVSFSRLFLEICGWLILLIGFKKCRIEVMRLSCCDPSQRQSATMIRSKHDFMFCADCELSCPQVCGKMVICDVVLGMLSVGFDVPSCGLAKENRFCCTLATIEPAVKAGDAG